MTERPDYQPKQPLSQEALQGMFARSDAELVQRAKEQRHRDEWPLRVQQTLDELRGQVAVLREQVAELQRGRG